MLRAKNQVTILGLILFLNILVFLCMLVYMAVAMERCNLFKCFSVFIVIVKQALIQMQDVASAVNVVQYYTNLQPSVR